MLTQIIPLVDSLLEDQNQEILKSACGSSLRIASNLNVEDRSSRILTLVLRILHDDEEETKIKALATLKSLIPMLNSDVCECFIMKEALMLATENIVKVRKAVAECIPKLCNTIKSPQAVDRLLATFRDLVKDSIWGVRKACAESIVDLFEGFGDTSKNLFVLALFLDLLRDKSNNVKQCAWLQLGPCIHSCKVTVPEEMVESYVGLSLNSSNKGEFQVHFAFYFPAVLEKLGKVRWESLKPGFLSILKDGDLRSKKSLLAGMHEIARLLGPDLACDELCSVYESVFSENAATKQLALTYLAKFTAQVPQERRLSFIKFLKVLHKFSASWRVRLSVAEQLTAMLEQIPLATCLAELYPIISLLAADKVCKVRESASAALGQLVGLALRSGSSHGLLVEFRDLASGSWTAKQTFLLACRELAALSSFAELYGEELEALCQDKTANTRIACARLVSSAKGSPDEFWKRMANKLTHDFDADVRFEVTGVYDVERGVQRLRPNAEKDSTLLTPMFRALFRDDDVEEVVNFRPEAYQLFGYLKAAVVPDVYGFVEYFNFDVANKAKMMVEF